MLRRFLARLTIAVTVAGLSAGLAGGSFAAVQQAVPGVPLLNAGGQPATKRPAPGSPAALLQVLKVAPEKRTGYDRDLFEHWVDEDGNGCDTRREVMLSEAVTPPSVGDRCWLEGGSWVSLYDGARVTGYPDGWELDHLVALAEAWDSGAYAWSSELRRQFANDLSHPEALILVTGVTNQAKSDLDPAQWMPPSAESRCGYLSDWVRVKHAWGLTVDRREKAALERGLRGCSPAATLVRR